MLNEDDTYAWVVIESRLDSVELFPILFFRYSPVEKTDLPSASLPFVLSTSSAARDCDHPLPSVHSLSPHFVGMQTSRHASDPSWPLRC